MFKNAYFGKPYKTQKGHRAIYLYPYQNGKHCLIVENVSHFLTPFNFYHDNGYVDGFDSPKHPLAIVSEWQNLIVCPCQWKDYYDYRIMFLNGEGHVRLSFFTDEIIISDLYVSEEHRNKGYATILLDKVDELLAGKKAIIYPLEEWQKEWYEKRGYIIDKEDSIDEEQLRITEAKSLAEDIDNGVMEKDFNSFYPHHEQSWIQGYGIGFYKGYRKALESHK